MAGKQLGITILKGVAVPLVTIELMIGSYFFPPLGVFIAISGFGAKDLLIAELRGYRDELCQNYKDYKKEREKLKSFIDNKNEIKT